MPKVFKGEKKSKTSSMKRKMLCPKCGHPDFHVTPRNKWTWLTGERLQCEKCGSTFKEPALVTVNERAKESKVEQVGSKSSHNSKPKTRHHDKKHHSNNSVTIKIKK